MSIIILTAPIRSGKTTLLQKYSTHHSTVGFLCPDIDGLRKLYHIKDYTFHDLEIKQEKVNNTFTENVVSIGKFQFLRSGFITAQEILISLMDNTVDDIIIDEIGKLELADQGLEPILSKFLQKYVARPSLTTDAQKLILVIRNTLLDACIEKYKLQDATILDIDSFGSTFDLA